MRTNRYQHMVREASEDGTLGYPWAYGVLRSILAGEHNEWPAQRVDKAISFMIAFDAEIDAAKTRTRTP